MRKTAILTGVVIALALCCAVFVLIFENKDAPVSSKDEKPTPTRATRKAIAEAGGRKAGILDLYKKITLGMSREQVEDILGEPVAVPVEQPSGEVQVAYLDHEYRERTLLPQESPRYPAGIFVTYRRGKVQEKSYNGQWVRVKE